MNTKLHIVSFFSNYFTLEKTFCYCFEKHIFHLRNALSKALPLAFLTGSQSAVMKSVISAVGWIWLWLHVPTFRASSPLNSGSLSVNILKPIYKGHYQDSGALDPTWVLGASCVWHWGYGEVKSLPISLRYSIKNADRAQEREVRVYVWVPVCAHVCMSAYVCVYMCVCECVCDDMHTLHNKLCAFSAQSIESWTTPVANDSHIEKPSL